MPGQEDEEDKQKEVHKEAPGAAQTCGELLCCGEAASFIDLFNLALTLVLKTQDMEPGRKQKYLDRGGVIRLVLALLFNITVLFIALFQTDPHFLLVLFFTVIVCFYTVMIVLLCVKLWAIGFRAKYYKVYIVTYKLVEMVIQIVTLILLSVGEDGPFSNGGDIFIAVTSILDIVLDFFQSIWSIYKYCTRGDDDRVKPFHGEENNVFCCIQPI